MSDSALQNRSPAPDAGYLELISGNPNFRRLWIATLVSLLGDWFNTIALYTLVSRLTGSPLALGAVFLFKMVPLGLASPLAGVLVDRWDRRRVMIGSDLLRAVVVLGFLGIDDPSQTPILYLLIALQVVIGSVFEPARSASLPNITTSRELLTANALSAATWSVMLALGAGFGGIATQAFGERAVFLIDSGTYLVSALFVARTQIPQATEPPDARSLWRVANQKIAEGWSYLRRTPTVGRLTLAKAGWSLGGGALVYLLALLGEAVAPHAAAAAMGVLYAVRGLGTGLGPLLARRFLPRPATWPSAMGWCILLSGAFYAALPGLPLGYWVALPVLLAHTTSGANWVLTTVLLQRRSEDRYRGRVFATEWLLIMSADAVSILAASLLLEHEILTLPSAFVVFGTVQVLCGLAWLLWVVPVERRDDAACG